MAKKAGAKVAPGKEAASVPPEYQVWAWPLLYSLMLELVEFGAKYARVWLLQHRAAARLPELLASDAPAGGGKGWGDEDELTKCAKGLATDAFLAIYNCHHPLKRGRCPKGHMVSVINSLGANKLRSHENWRRGVSVAEENVADPQLNLEPVEPPGGGKRASPDRSFQVENAGRLKASLPRDWQFEAALVEAIGSKGLDDRKALAQALDASLEQVNEGLGRIAGHVTETQPELSKMIFEIARAAVPAHTIGAVKKGRDPQT